MLIRAFSRLLVLIAPLIVFGYGLFSYFDEEPNIVRQVVTWPEEYNRNGNEYSEEDVIGITLPPIDAEPGTSKSEELKGVTGVGTNPLIPPAKPLNEQAPSDFVVDSSKYHEISSLSTPDRKFFAINFGVDYPALNPNIIPHPHAPNAYIIVAQLFKKNQDNIHHELVCNAAFLLDGSLSCLTPPHLLPVAPTQGTPHCDGNIAHFALNVGPHDMRVFYGPEVPYAIYGSQSAYTCFGMLAQDFRSLVDDYGVEASTATLFKESTELQRPTPWGKIEKNWFFFWDAQNEMYVHHDVAPKRVFAKVSADGSVGPDLAPATASNDEKCMTMYLPKLAEDENIHQATNSLSITLCSRTDPDCHPNDSNTYILTVLHYKTWHSFHSVYEPYIMLFQRNAPFSIHAMSQKPLWIHGRGPLTRYSQAVKWEGKELPKDHTEMFYITGISWKHPVQKYHGYVDDVLFLTFGIEDSRTAGIDVRAGDLVEGLGLCTSA